MSKKRIIEILKNVEEYMQSCIDEGYHKFVYNNLGHDEKCIDIINTIEGLLNLYNKEKEKTRIMQAEFERLENIEDDTVQLKLLLKEEKEKNKKLDKENHALFEAYNFNDTNLLAKILKEYRKELKNSISKDKIREKIEELEKIDEKNKKEDLYKAIQSLNFKEIDKISNKISISISIKKFLKELLEE